MCQGNNLSGAFTASGTPDYHSPIPDDPESTTPKNYTGGLYAADLFLQYYIPMIEQSPAFKQGGLIDITFDEAFAPFTYTGNSFNNANDYRPTADDQPNYTSSITSDSAGENLYGRNVDYEPTGPNSTLGTNAKGDQLYPGPGNNAFVDCPPVCTQTSPALVPAYCVPGIVRGGAGSPPAARTDTVTGGTGSSEISDPSILADDTGREVTGTNIPANSFVGAVTDTGPTSRPPTPDRRPWARSSCVGQDGSPAEPAGPLTSITLSAEGDPSDLAPGQTPDPLFNATPPTTGGGDTGSVLISPYIRPGTATDAYYNHYSWLRTMEDIFDVAQGNDHTLLTAGTVSGGLDGQGHLGYAAQPGLCVLRPRCVHQLRATARPGARIHLTSLTVPKDRPRGHPGRGYRWPQGRLCGPDRWPPATSGTCAAGAGPSAERCPGGHEPLYRGTCRAGSPPSRRGPGPPGRPGRPGRALRPARPGTRAGPQPDPARRAAAALGVLARCSTAAKPVAIRPTPTFGAYPSYLPKATLNDGSDAVLTGTIQRPALTNEGDAVKVKMSQGRCW